jgi:hypothetical protein
MARKSTGKKLRFEVFKRDSFTCQYCGRKAPDVVLNVDHVSPVSKGGGNNILNLITSCSDCNGGKGARELGDDSVLAKQRDQLAELEERREQLRMMIAWRDGLKDIEGMKVDEVVRKYKSHAIGWSPNEHGMISVRKWVSEFPMDILLDAIDVAKDKVVMGSDGVATQESVREFFGYIPRVASCKLRDRREPGVGQLLRLRGYMRTWMSFRDWECLDLLKEAFACGIPTDELRSIARRSSSWSSFRSAVYEAMGAKGAS